MNLLKIIKRIILFILKEFFSFVIKLSLFVLILVGIVVFFTNKKLNIKEDNIILKDNIYVNINLAQSYKERNFSGNFLEEKTFSFYSLLKIISELKDEVNVDGIILNLDNISLNYAQVEELSKEIEIYKKNTNKEVIAYMQNVDKKNYYLASYANKIYMPPTNSTTVNIYPYFKESFYKRNLFDKLGVKFKIVNTGDYKSYGEDLANTEMSKEHREDSTRILEKNYKKFLEVVSKNRNIDSEDFRKLIENGDLVAASSQDLYERKLIDDFLYWNQLENKIEKDKIISIEKYKTYLEKNFIEYDKSKNIIYILPLEGEIADSEVYIFDQIFINSNIVVNELEKLEKNEKIKGIVLRINSPGGSALTSDIINQKIKEVRKKKPIYVSMSGVAASGGYYIASNTDKIFADENTITGSIGVVSILPNFSKFLDKVGIKNEKIYKGKFADIYSSDELTEEKYNKILKSNLKVYDDFLKEVSVGRGINRKDLERIAQGRVWIGKEALDIGLIDEIGGIFDTVESLAEKLKLEEYKVVFSEETVDIKNIFRKYSKFLKADKLNYLKEKAYRNDLYNKPIIYFPYEILD